MTIASAPRRSIGTMVAYGFPERDLASDLAIAQRLGASVVEILPDWKRVPDPTSLRRQLADAGLSIHSAHGCWGGQSIKALRVDLGDLDPARHSASVVDSKLCVDWLAEAGGTCLVLHPGGLSSPEDAQARREALTRGLDELADHAEGTGVVLCVENMPPGVYPGSLMADLAAIVFELDRPEIAVALDTGHAHLSRNPREETLEAGRLLKTTHVHDNLGRQDSHLPPGLGTIDWDAWVLALDAIEYRGPIMLECIRHFRKEPDSLSDELIRLVRRLAGLTAASS